MQAYTEKRFIVFTCAQRYFCVLRLVGKSLGKAPETVEPVHVTELSNIDEQQNLYPLALQPTVLFFSSTTTCQEMKFWMYPKGNLLFVFWALTNLQRPRRAA